MIRKSPTPGPTRLPAMGQGNAAIRAADDVSGRAVPAHRHFAISTCPPLLVWARESDDAGLGGVGAGRSVGGW